MAYTGQTLKNPASGERITFRRTAADTAGELVMVDLELPAGRRVPGGRHVHPLQEERFAVIEGTMHFRLGRKRVTAGPGEVVVVPPGVKHDFANAGDADALVRGEIRPALGMERLFETAIDLAERGRTMLGGIPKPLDLALFVREFEREVQAAFPPRWVQRVALTPLAWVARHRRRDGSIPKLVLTSLEPKTQWANSTWPDASAGSGWRVSSQSRQVSGGASGPASAASKASVYWVTMRCARRWPSGSCASALAISAATAPVAMATFASGSRM